MWSSEKSMYNKNKKRGFSSPTPSSTYSSSSPPNPKPLRTMEEVWKDINAPSLPGKEPRITNINFHSVNIPDFLAQPFANKNTHKTFNLNSGPDFNFEEPSRGTTPFVAPGFVCGSKTRVTDPNESIGDRRYKRMIKNRESAARSRARKQECIFPLLSPLYLNTSFAPLAYRFELEEEVKNLRAENDRLKKQQELLCLEEDLQLPPKHTLYRTSTAPF